MARWLSACAPPPLLLSPQMLHEVSSGNMVHHLCGDACFNRFRATKGLKTSCCDSCGLYIYAKSARAEYLLHDGQQRRFCNTTCLAQFKKVANKILSFERADTLNNDLKLNSVASHVRFYHL